MPSLSFARYTTKLEKELHTALNARPPRINLTELGRPPRLEINNTPKEIAMAPIKAITPTKFSPNITPTPNKIATVAPRDAPDEIPRIYGSANGFLTIACMITPDTARPAPIIAAISKRGILSSHIIVCSGPFIGSSIANGLEN